MDTWQHTELLGLSNEQLTELIESFGQAPYRVAQLLDGLYRQRWSELEHFSTLPLAFRRRLQDAGYSVGHPAVEKRFLSSDGTVRYLFSFADGQSVETVWMPEGDGGEAGDGSDSGDEELAEMPDPSSSRTSIAAILPNSSSPAKAAISATGAEGPAVRGRDSSSKPSPRSRVAPAVTNSRQRTTGNRSTRATICVSSQVGCAVECAFCMTALLGLKRNLTAGEIVGQVLAVLNDQQVGLDRDRINLVFMGQGEPFLNYDNFMQAVRLLVREVGLSDSRMTVSTSGIVPRITDFGSEEIRPKLAVSLNASNQALRTQVMPITRKWTIEKLLAALRDFPLRNRERLTFEYVVLGGINDGVSHARELVELVRGLRAKVNLIALNAGPDIPFSTPADEQVAAFQSVLMAAGIPTFVRRPRGRDIYAACGQLKRTTELIQLS